MYELLSKRIKNADGELEVFTYNSFPQAFRNQVFYILEDVLEPHSAYNETSILIETGYYQKRFTRNPSIILELDLIMIVLNYFLIRQKAQDSPSGGMRSESH